MTNLRYLQADHHHSLRQSQEAHRHDQVVERFDQLKLQIHSQSISQSGTQTARLDYSHVESADPDFRSQVVPKQRPIDWSWAPYASCWVLVGTVLIQRGRRKYNKKSSTGRSQSPPNAGWKLTFLPAHWVPFAAWQNTLRSYNVISEDSPIFEACGTGDFQAVQRLLREGSASPFDMTLDGLTPLYVSRSES